MQAVLPDVDDGDKRVKMFSKMAHSKFKDFLQTYMNLFDVNMTHFCSWLKIPYNRFTIFFKNGVQSIASDNPVSSMTYRFVASQEVLLGNRVQEFFASNPDVKQVVLKKVSEKMPDFDYEKWLNFDMTPSNRLKFSKLFHVLVNRNQEALDTA
jgi:hypothetical protein